ncbi:interferon-induced, double-stranded RNA-activated protein kinase-like isoform X2 [Plectropomus leopardus]|uniref:interferon-induced, double-stranded RNA-activated protein kinase-like isoform X2 n=1 Tax=Plectropomus leopardus TaxID=160734 RepID=UPI001C4B8B8B|nr:interferon-induced, double-stranded RNA-activated protein kinase-like isoform X2 [Plectropomus leopardus]
MEIAELNEYAQRKRLELKYEDVGCVGPDHLKTFTVRAVVDGKAYPDGVGKNKKEAKQMAAKNALRNLMDKPTDSAGEEKDSGVSSQQEEGSSQNVTDIIKWLKGLSVRVKDGGFTKINFIGLINHFCQKTLQPHYYTLVDRRGPPHNPRFFFKLVINDKDYPIGEGKTVKEAKQMAAWLAWSALQEQSDWDSKISLWSTSLEDDAPTSLESLASTESLSMGTNDSGIFSLRSSEDQHGVKDMGTSQEISTQSRFTSDFDSINRLGSGGFGRVYKARHKQLNMYYAVKIVRCEEKAFREVGTLSDLLHPNIVRYYTFWMEDSEYQWDSSAGSHSSIQSTENSSAKYLYIQMELCDTKTLRGWIKEKNAQPVQDSRRREESRRMAQQIVSGVEYIHSKRHIHRDLKPDNILFGLGGEVKIGDFGLVTKDDNDDDDYALMKRSGGKGTPSYMAPEQMREKTYDRKVDIFALGLIYIELLWKISTGHERREFLMNARHQKLPKGFSLTFPQENQIIELMLCEKPEKRPEASQVKTELEKWAQTFNTPTESMDWTVCEPVVNTVDEVHTYSLQSDAGRFECGVSALRWVCGEKVSFEYQFCLWEEHRDRTSCMNYMPAGPLLDIRVTAGKFQEVHLPHWICVDHNSKMSDMFAVIHVDADGDVVEQVSEVTASHVKLLQPVFSPRGAMIRKMFGRPVKVFCDTLIYKTNKEFLTLDVYLVPPDRALQQELEKKQSYCGSKLIPKPGPDKSMRLGNHFSITTDKADAKIQPSKRELRYDGRNVFEVFVRNADSDFTLWLESEQNTVWQCTLHKGDYQSQSTDYKQGQHFVDRFRTALINRVNDTEAILDELRDLELISNENYDAVRALKTTRDQMRDIHRIVTAAGTESKDAFYEILKRMKNMRPLISELEGSG